MAEERLLFTRRRLISKSFNESSPIPATYAIIRCTQFKRQATYFNVQAQFYDMQCSLLDVLREEFGTKSRDAPKYAIHRPKRLPELKMISFYRIRIVASGMKLK